MTTDAVPWRRVRVEPLSARAELGHVIRVGMVVIVGAWMFLATDSSRLQDARAGQHLLPFQRLVQDRPSLEQRMFRELQEGLLEAEARRATDGAWPDVRTLAADGIPPFAFDPTEKGAHYQWRLLRDGAYANYLGIPREPGAPAWLVLVLEPEPGAPPDPAREDEEHHRSSTGAMLHVSTWVGGDIKAPDRIIRAPQAEGWTQLYAVGPSLAPPPAG
jgi:hypothetical protein